MKALACAIFTVFIGVCINAASVKWGFDRETLALYGIIYLLLRVLLCLSDIGGDK